MAEKRQIVREIFKPARVRFPTRPVALKGRSDLCQLDLCEMGSLAKENSNYKFILCFVNAFTKYAHATALRGKTSSEVAKAAEKMFEFQKNLLGAELRLAQVDAGGEFKGEFVKMTRKRNIHVYSSMSDKKASIVERFNKTLKTNIYKSFLLRSSLNWISVLDKIVDKYNKTKHRTTGMTPEEASKEENELYLLETVYKKKNDRPRGVPKYKIGQAVRVSRKAHVFSRGYTPQFSVEIFYISQINNKIPITYHLVDYKSEPIQGGFYELEIAPVRFKDVYLVERIVKRDPKNKRVKIKWAGYPSPTWEPEENFVDDDNDDEQI